ncbi:MAG TPA: hypothetical protein VMB50_23525 [Myxococcales bacterium]|nr:hypothetical protein [Myxococcales bacterium]
MSAVLAAAMLLSASPGVWHYRTPDGVDHYAGAGDVPPAYRAGAQPVDLAHVPLNGAAAKDIEAAVDRAAAARAEASSQGGAARAARWLPDLPWFIGGAILLVAAAWLLHRLYRRRYSGDERVWRAARLATWLAGVSVLLVVVRLTIPHLGRFRAQLARFGFDALVAEEDRNSDALHHGLQQAELKAAGAGAPASRPPPQPFWSGAPPPPGLLHR